jgi:putative FmdB family regulatory protein
MPLYEYGCAACGAVSEINHRMSDPAPTDCPVCGAPQLSKMISAAGFRLKGAGWYETDFKADGKRNLAGDSGDSPPVSTKSDDKPAVKPVAEAKPAAAKAEAKSESKPAAAPAAAPVSKPSTPPSSSPST